MGKVNKSSQVGTRIDIVVKKPTHQRVMLMSGKNLRISWIWREIV